MLTARYLGPSGKGLYLAFTRFILLTSQFLSFSSGEGLVYDTQGVAIQGITNASIWDQNFARTRVPIIDKCEGGEKIELWVEAAANSLFGVFTDFGGFS